MRLARIIELKEGIKDINDEVEETRDLEVRDSKG